MVNKTTQPNPFQTIKEANDFFPTAAEFRLALVDDVHFGEKRFSNLDSKELLQACGVESGVNGDFCISQVPSNYAAFKRGDESGWTFIYTYRIQGRNRRKIRFTTKHGDGGVCESCEGPYIYRRTSPRR